MKIRGWTATLGTVVLCAALAGCTTMTVKGTGAQLTDGKMSFVVVETAGGG